MLFGKIKMFVTLKTENSNMRTIKAAPARASHGLGGSVAAPPAPWTLPPAALLSARETWRQTESSEFPVTEMIHKAANRL